MTVDVNVIENNIYTKICEAFSEFATSRLKRYESVFDFLRVTEVEKIVSNTTSQVYDLYCDFCIGKKYEPLAHTTFSRTVCECGFNTRYIYKMNNGKKKKLIFFYME